MADKNQAIYDWNLPKQDVAAADVAVKRGYQPSQEFDVESGAGGRFIEAQKKAIEDSKIQSQIQAKRISDYEADKKAKIDAVTHQFAQPLVKGIPIVSKQYSDIVNNVRKEAEHNYNLYEKSQQEQQDKQIESLPNHFFGFGKDKELYDKVHSFRADVAKGAEESLGTMPDWMKTNAVLKMFAPESAGVLEGAKQVAYNVFNTAEELLDKPTMKYKQHFQEEAKKMYPQASPETINNEAKKFYENWIIDKAKKERPGDFKEEGLTHYIDNTGNPTTELKKDAYRVANGDTKRLADATKQLIDYERGNFNAAKSRNQENWEQLEQMLVEKGSGIPYILQKTVGGALGAVNAEIETAKGLSSVLEGGSYSEGVANQKKNNASSIPTEMAVDLKGHPYVEAASSLGYGITNLLTRAYLAKSTFGEGETKPMQNFVNSIAKDAPSYGKAAPYIFNALKNTPVSKFANITDKALDMSKIFFVPTLNDNIAKNRELGYSDKENYIKSTKDAIASMYIFSLIAHEPEGAQKQFERLLNPEQRALFTNIKNTGKSMAISGSAMAANKVYQDYADSKGDFDLGKSISGAGKEFVQGAMFDLGMKALNPQQLLSKSPQSDAIAYFLRDKDALRQQLDSKLASGQITPQQYIDIPKAFNNLKSHFQEGKGFELDDRAAAQYATEKAKYGLLNNIVSQLKATPNSDPKKIAEAERRMNESARDIAQIRNGTYLKGRVISSKEMLDVAAKTKPENEKKAYTKDKKKLVIVSAPYVQEKMALEPLKTDDNVRKNLAILTHKEALQHNIDLHNKTQEEIDLIENGHKEIKGVRKALPMSEKDVKRLDALKEVRSNINKSLEPLGGTDAVKDMLEYDDKANNGHIVIDKNGKVIDGKKQAATKLFNGVKEGNIVRSLTDAEKANLAQKSPSPEIKKDLGIVDEVDADEPTKQSVVDRTGINHPFAKKVVDALKKLGVVKDDFILGGQVQSDGEGGFATGDMYFKKDGSISFVNSEGIIQFDKNGNVKLTELERDKVRTKTDVQSDIDSKTKSKQDFEKIRDSEDFKYKDVTTIDPLGRKVKSKRLKTADELKETTDKINKVIDKLDSEISDYKKELETAPEPSIKETAPPESQPAPLQSEGDSQGIGLPKPYEQRTDEEHAQYIKDKFLSEFTKKGVSKEGVDAAIALMEARAKASGQGDKWYRQIEDVGNGEFQSPDIKQQIIGEKGAINMSNAKDVLDNLNAAREMETQGKTPKEIHLATGWERGKDGRWRYEVADNINIDATKLENLIKSNATNIKISTFADISDLAKIYPEINNIKVHFLSLGRDSFAMSYLEHNGEKYIGINTDEYDTRNKQSIQQFRNELLHELQHFIQSNEGFSKGANRDAIFENSVKMLEKEKGRHLANKERESIQNSAHEIYHKVSGEVEARNVQNREKLSQKERKEQSLSETEDVARDQQILIDNLLFQNQGGEAKGALETLANGRKVIHALENPDFSTTVHELAHIFEDEISANEREAIQKWAKTKGWTTETSEAFARGFERYLREGKAPTEELKTIFQKAKEWLSTIYKTLKDSPIEKKLSPEVREVFDNLFKQKEESNKINEPSLKETPKEVSVGGVDVEEKVSGLQHTKSQLEEIAKEEGIDNAIVSFKKDLDVKENRLAELTKYEKGKLPSQKTKSKEIQSLEKRIEEVRKDVENLEKIKSEQPLKETPKEVSVGVGVGGDVLLKDIDKKDENYDSIEEAVKGKNFVKQTVSIDELVAKDKDLQEYLNDNKETKGRKIEKAIIIGDIARGGETQKGGVIDGFHRIAQAIANGETEIDAYVEQPLKETPKEGGKHQGVGTSIKEGEVPTTDENRPEVEIPKSGQPIQEAEVEIPKNSTEIPQKNAKITKAELTIDNAANWLKDKLKIDGLEGVHKAGFGSDELIDLAAKAAKALAKGAIVTGEHIKAVVDSLKEGGFLEGFDENKILKAVADSVTPKEGLEPNGDTRINKDAIKEKYDQIFEHEQVSAQQEANDARESLVNSAEAKGISAEQEAENHVRNLASQEYGTHYAVSSYDIITTAFHKANLERDLARAKQAGEEHAAILIERQIEAVNDLILQKLGRASGKHLNLFSSVFNLAKDGTLKATQELLSKALGVDVPMTMEDLLKKHPKGDRDTEYKRLKPYVETIEAQKKAIEDKLKGDAEINEKYDKKDIEDYIKREVEKRIAEAKGKKTTKASKSLRSLAERIRKSDTLEKLGLGEPVLTDMHKAGTSFNVKEALAKVIDLIADGIDKAKAISDVLKEHGITSSKQFSTLVEQVIAKASSVNRDEVLDKIKEVSQAGALQNSISKPMVESGLVKDLVDYHIQEGLKADEVIKNTLADIKEVLTNVTEAQLVDAILQRGDFKIESRRAAISNEGTRRREVKTIATKMAKLKAFEAADEIHAIELDETLTKEQKKAAIEAKKSEFEKELDKQIAEHEAAIKAAKEKNTNDAKIEANVNKLQSELDRLKERRGKEEVAKGAPIEKSQREKDLIDEIVKEKAKWSSEKREQKRYEANVAELERLTNRAKKEKAQSKDKTPIEKSEREKELDAKIKEQEDKWDAEITAAQEARKANNKLWAETQRQLKQVNDLKEKIAKAEELFKKANPKSNATPDTPEIEGYKKQLRDTRKQTLEKEREIRKIASEMTQEAKIREKIEHIKKTKTLFEEAIKDRKKTRPELQKLREELNNAMTDAGIRAQVSDKTDIKIAKEYEAKIEDVRNSDLSDDEKVAKIQDLEKQRDAEIGKTKQGVLANLKSNLDGSIDDLTSKLASEKDPVKAEEIKKVLEKIKELSKFTKATTQNAQDKINKAYAELDKLIKDNKGNEYEQMFKDLQDEFRGDFGKALNEIQQKRLYDTSVRRLREAQRILNSGLVTEIPSSKYDKERDNALLMHKAKYKPVWQKVQRMKQRAIEQNKGFMDKALDLRTRYLIMGLHPIETVLTAGVTKPFFDTLMKQTAGRLAGMITGIGHVSHKDIGKTFGAITKGILDKKGTPLEQKAINKYISKMNQQYVDALKAYDAIPDKTSKEALAAEKKLLRAEIAKEATLPYFFINANSAVDIKQIMVHAATDFDERMGEYNQSYKKDRTKLENLGYWIDAVNRTHGAIKSVSARQAMFYDYIESLQHLQKVKGEITPADAQLAWFLAADKGYKQGKFSERTMLSDLITRGKTHDNAWVRGVSKFIFPVAKIAINIAKLHVDIGLPAEAIYKLAEATKAGKKLNVEAGDAARLQDNFRKGIDSLNLEQKKYLNTLLTRGLYGVAMWIIGVWLNHEDKLKYGGAFSPTDPFHKRLGQVLGSDGKPLKAGEWEINGWRLPEPLNIVMNHSGYFLPISLSTVWSQQVNREGATDAKTEAIHKNDVKNLMLATTNELTGKLPLQGAIQTIGMLYGEGLEYGLASMLPNTRGINKFVDKDENGEPVKRDTDSPTFLGKIYNIWKANNVGLSKTLPTKAEAALDKQANKVKEDIAFDNAPESVQDLKTVKQTEDAIKDAKFEIEKIKAALENPEHPYVDDNGVPYTKEELESMKLDAEDDIKAYEDDIITISKQK